MHFRRVLPALAVTVVLVAACQSGPAPTVLPASVAPASVPPTAPPATADAGPALAAALRDAVDIPDITADLQRLQAIADEHGGTRPAGSAGYDASVDFVADELRRVGYEVELQPVELPAFEQLAPSVIEIAGGAPLEDIRDFKAMLLSGSGDVTARVFDLGVAPGSLPGESAGLGCDPEHWTDVPAGVIVLARPGPCRRLEVVQRAQSAGAVAIVTAYPWPRDGVLRPTLVDPSGVQIPAIGATEAVGTALAQAALEGTDVRVATTTRVEIRTSFNVIAETAGGDPANVLMLGGHLDSVVDGPGINDNGTGTMTVLEIAREVAALAQSTTGGTAPAWKVRVAFWTGEEIGLLGSFAYARGLDPETIGATRAYLNFDMVGSRNGIRVVYDGATTTNPVSSGVVGDLFVRALEAQGLTWEHESVGAVSDHFPLDQLGIGVGGLFSGANDLKTAAQASLFGGTAGAPGDPCYHLACDTIDNVDPALLEQMARAAAWVVGALISGEVDLGQ